MDIEFHYYMTYLIAARAGFSPTEARVIATASQYVDDNDVILEVEDEEGGLYRNYISQTLDITKPKAKLFRIYPLFHFLPGDPMAPTAWRKDGAMHWLNTTPNSANARAMIAKAKASGSPYRVGVACHTYVDTWAHQNFVGYYTAFNSLEEMLTKALPNIGHAEARHCPDEPGLVWDDRRLIEPRVDNRARFLEAARHLFLWLAGIANSGPAATDPEGEADALLADLKDCVRERDADNRLRDTRVARYRALANRHDYGGTQMPEYREDDWLEAAVTEQVRGFRDRWRSGLDLMDAALDKVTLFKDRYTWKDSARYRETDWYLFQEAVKGHQADVQALLFSQDDGLPGSFIGLALDNY